MKIEINPEAEFSTGEAARMLSIPQDRIYYMLQNDHVPAVKVPEKGGRIRYKVKFKDFEAILRADAELKKHGRNRNRVFVERAQFQALVDRVEFLEKAFDHYTAPEVAQTTETR